LQVPPGGIVLRALDASWNAGRTTVNGKPARWRGRELRMRALPAHIRIEPAATRGTPVQPTSKARP
jgi:hypothetical protein